MLNIYIPTVVAKTRVEMSAGALYLLQLFLDHPLLLSDVAELGGVLLSKGSPRLLGCSLFS